MVDDIRQNLIVAGKFKDQIQIFQGQQINIIFKHLDPHFAGIFITGCGFRRGGDGHKPEPQTGWFDGV